MTINPDSAQQTFIEESRELLQQIERCLLQLEASPDDGEAMNALFRAAHTIKGSAGLFGFDRIVSFTHCLESVLDRVRSREIAFDGDLAALMLPCADHIELLVREVASDEVQDKAATDAAGAVLLKQLSRYLEPEAGAAAADKPLAAAPAQQAASAEDGVANRYWHISLRFGREVLRNGMDPLAFIRYLGRLGDVVRLTTVFDGPAEAAEFDPEACYLGFEISFDSTATREAIAGAFDFVRDDCVIHILPPHSRIAEYVELIAKLPGEDMRVGELLTGIGALTKDELARALAAQNQQAAAEGEAKPLGEILVERSVVPQAVVSAALDKQQKVKEQKADENRFIRVQAAKLDELINYVGELVIAGAGAAMIAQRSRNTAMMESTASIAVLVEEIRNSALQLRMVQIGETFNRFHRVVRDVSRELGKDIGLVITGAETELDKTVVERIGDPLMHLVRNAMDHGIEDAATREAAGKPPKGTLKLNAYHDSGNIVIEVADDGRGLNRQRILDKARQRGLVGEDEQPDDDAILNLIFEPGFSTAEKITNLSGRGVGMDVVKRNIEALRGSVKLKSVEGQGATVEIRLPLTLAIIDGFLVGVEKSSYVVPLDLVVECLELHLGSDGTDKDYLDLRGEVLPLLRLREVFDVAGAMPKRASIVVVRAAGQKVGLVVDRLMGELQTVIKPLGRMFKHLSGISGSTILGDGGVALILDVPVLLQKVIESDAAQIAPPRVHGTVH
jgi:two-component system chemotaxis sensor kinase CheA